MTTGMNALPASRMRAGVLMVAMLVLSPAGSAAVSGDGLWQDMSASASVHTGAKYSTGEPRLLQLDREALIDRLSRAAGKRQAVLTLPLPEGGFGRFRVAEFALLEPALAARLPAVRIYRGYGLDDPTAVAALSLTPRGLRARIVTTADSLDVAALRVAEGGAGELYAGTAKSRRAAARLAEGRAPLQCLTVAEPSTPTARPKSATVGLFRLPEAGIGGELRSYRLAIAASGEYVQALGGSVDEAMLVIIETVNQLSAIFERDAAIRFELVDSEVAVFADPASDPYPNADLDALLGVNQAVLDDLIGERNYDFGHLFTVGGGGVAIVGATCADSVKAQGVSGAPPRDLDSIDFVLLVAHEMGHQFDATHTFNGDAGSCSSDFDDPQRSADTAFEPGSGSTLMSYAGICHDGVENQNVQTFPDDYFHAVSLGQMEAFVSSRTGGGQCDRGVDVDNRAPIVDAGPDERVYTIPEQTPFELTALADDLDGDTLTYTWEQLDLGSAGMPDEDASEGPLFRSFPPAATPERSFPQLGQLLGLLPEEELAHASRFEVLSDRSRELTFRLTVRDGYGGLNQDNLVLQVRAGSGPFEVLEPNGGESWRGYQQRTVRWRVANTDDSPFDCAAVDILVSGDGGLTYPYRVGNATANDGREDIAVPNLDTTRARVKVRCSDNVFFNISESDFRIREGEPASDRLLLDDFETAAAN